MNPTHLKNYADQLNKFIEKEELAKGRVYACSQHVPTIGVGYALAEKNGGGFKPRAGLDDDLARIGKTLTAADRNRLSHLCDMLNDGTIKQAITGEKLKDPFDLTISKEQAKQLFLICVPKYDAVIKKKLGLRLYNELQNSKEMVSLFSLAYNAPALIGNNLVGAIREGNRAKVQYEILYDSNKKRDVGLDNRRKREAAVFGRYDGEKPTDAELKAEEEIQIAHRAQIAAYSSEMDGKRNRKSAKRASGPKIALNKNRKRQQPGTAPNQKEVRNRTHDVKAHPRNQGHTIFERIIETFGRHDKVAYRDWTNHPAGLDDQHYHKQWS